MTRVDFDLLSGSTGHEDLRRYEDRYQWGRVTWALGSPRPGRPSIWECPLETTHGFSVASVRVHGTTSYRVLCFEGCADDRVVGVVDVVHDHLRGLPAPNSPPYDPDNDGYGDSTGTTGPPTNMINGGARHRLIPDAETPVPDRVRRHQSGTAHSGGAQ